MLRKMRSLIGRKLQSFLRPFDLELSRISVTARTLEEMEAHKELEAKLMAQLQNTGVELEAVRRHLADVEQQKKMHEAAKPYINRESLILLPKLLACLAPNDRFVIIDGGAREMEQDYRWRPFPPERLRFFGFEADAAEAARLTDLAAPAGLERRFYPAALGGKSGKAIFEHNKAGGGSSLLSQNRAVTDRWKFENPHRVSLAREMFFPTHDEEITVTTLSDWANATETTEVDFIKLNVQGAELDILKSGGKAVDTALGILVEVAFVESYRNRPMFSDLDKFLRGADFTFFDLLAHHYIGRARISVAAQQLVLAEPALSKQVSAWGQLVEGHALYLRDPVASDQQDQMAPKRVIKLAALAEAFGQVEYALELLAWLRERNDVRDTDMGETLNRILNEATVEYESYRQ